MEKSCPILPCYHYIIYKDIVTCVVCFILKGYIKIVGPRNNKFDTNITWTKLCIPTKWGWREFQTAATGCSIHFLHQLTFFSITGHSHAGILHIYFVRNVTTITLVKWPKTWHVIWLCGAILVLGSLNFYIIS